MDYNNATTMSKNKKKSRNSLRNSLFATVAFIFVTIILFSAQTYAYFTSDQQSDNNKIAAGTLKVELIEMQDSNSGRVEYVNPVAIMPGKDVSKIVMVQNTGTLPMYIRIKIEKSINKPADTLPANWEDLISCNFDLDNNSNDPQGSWVFKDGYYYYKLILSPQQVTEPLFDLVSFSTQMGNEFTNSEISLTIICEAAQINGSDSPTADSVSWPDANSTNDPDTANE